MGICWMMIVTISKNMIHIHSLVARSHWSLKSPRSRSTCEWPGTTCEAGTSGLLDGVSARVFDAKNTAETGKPMVKGWKLELEGSIKEWPWSRVGTYSIRFPWFGSSLPKRSRYLWDPRGARGPGSQPGEGPMHAGCTVLAQFSMFFAAAFGCLMLCGNQAIPSMMALYLMG